jgi:hypothetical protein
MKSIFLGVGWLMACSGNGPVHQAPPDGPDGPDGSIDGAPGGASDAPSEAAVIAFTIQHADGSFASTDLVAYQDGDGPWTEVTGDHGVYALSVSQGRYGLVFGCARPDGPSLVELSYYAVSDGAQRFGIDACATGSALLVPISGTVSHVTDQDQDEVRVDDQPLADLTAGWTGAAAPGIGELIGLRLTGGRPDGIVLDRVTYARDMAYEVDFAGEVAPAERALQIDAGAGSTAPIRMTTSYLDVTGAPHAIDAADDPTTYRVVPVDALDSGLSVLSLDAAQDQQRRQAVRRFRSAIDQIVELPAAYEPASPPQFDEAAAYPTVVATLPKRAAALDYQLMYRTPVPNTSNAIVRWTVTYSAAWADAAPGDAVVSRLPDLSALPSWQPAMAPVHSVPGAATWMATVATGPAHRLPGTFGLTPDGRSALPTLPGDDETMASTLRVLPTPAAQSTAWSPSMAP